jgi:hypothetical protein
MDPSDDVCASHVSTGAILVVLSKKLLHKRTGDMRIFLRSLSEEKFNALRRLIGCEIGDDWQDIASTDFIHRYAAYAATNYIYPSTLIKRHAMLR